MVAVTITLGSALPVMGTSKAWLSLVRWRSWRVCEAVAFNGDDGPAFFEAGNEQKMRSVADCVDFFVGDDSSFGVGFVELT